MSGGALAAAGVPVLLGLEGGSRFDSARTQPSAEVPSAIPGGPSWALGPAGTVLGPNYRVVREGRGGMGVVYEASDQALERR